MHERSLHPVAVPCDILSFDDVCCNLERIDGYVVFWLTSTLVKLKSKRQFLHRKNNKNGIVTLK